MAYLDQFGEEQLPDGELSQIITSLNLGQVRG